MGASRENRPSENTLRLLHGIMPHLFVQVWYPLKEEALESIDQARALLTKLAEQLEEEAKQNG